MLLSVAFILLDMFACLTNLCWSQRMQVVVKLPMFTVKLGGEGAQQLCFAIW